MSILASLCCFLRAFLVGRGVLAAENLALRQQLAILQRENPRPKLRWRDRLFWVWLSRLFSGWRDWLVIVTPDTVVRWHRAGFRLFWRWKSSGGTPGRPTIPRSVIAPVRTLCR